MIRKRVSAWLSNARRAFGHWGGAGSAGAMVLLLVAGTRIVAPDIDSQALADFLRSGGGPLVRLYDLLVGGALTRGGLLAIGIVPFLTAKIYLRLAQMSFPSFAKSSRDPVRLQRWTRGLTFGFALIQSYGFTRFLQSVPGVVADPGMSFTLRTVALLTGSAMTIAWLSERISAATEPESPREAETLRDATPSAPALSAPSSRETSVPAREQVRVNRG